MTDLNKLSPQALGAAMRGGTQGWGQRASVFEHARYIEPIVGRKGRRKCYCGCGRRATHLGKANGIALAHGCELWMRRWVVDPFADLRSPEGEELGRKLAKP